MILELGSQAYNALKHNRRRSILTMLGMAWGIATVVLLLAYGAGFERGLWVAFRSWGTNLVFIFPGRTSMQAGGTKAGTQVKLTVNDLDYLQAEVPLLKRISPEAFKQSTVAFGTRSGSYGISGVYPYYQRMRRMDVEDGTFFTDLDENTHSRVAILGADVKKKLFSGENALGEKVRVLAGVFAENFGLFDGMADRERIAMAVEAAAFPRLQAQERATGFNEKPVEAAAFFREGRVDGWRQTLTAEQASRLAAAHGAVMRRCDYDTQLLPLAAERGAA